MTARTEHGRRYGSDHQRARTAALTALRANPGTPCPRCGDGLDPDDDLHLDHSDDATGYLGLVHSRCNLSAGGRLGQARRRGWSPATAPREPREPGPLILPELAADGRWTAADAALWETAVARLPTTRRWTETDHELYRKISAPPGHLRGYCRPCGRWDCPDATPHAPHGQQPW